MTSSVPDGGYGWVVCLVGFFMNFVADGISMNFGIFVPVVMDKFNSTLSQTVLIGSLACGTTYLFAPPIMALTGLVGARIVVFSGGLVTSLLLVGSAHCESILALTLVYGVLAGSMFGLMLPPSMLLVNQYFDQKRALANSIASCGSTIGISLMAPVITYLLVNYKLSVTFYTLALLSFVGSLLALLLKPLPRELKEATNGAGAKCNANSKSHNTTSNKNTILEKQLIQQLEKYGTLSLEPPVETKKSKLLSFAVKMFDPRALTNTTFLLYLIGTICQNLGCLVPSLHLPYLMVSGGLTSSEAGIAVFVLSASNGVGRLLCGLATKCPQHSLKITAVFSVLTCGIIMLYPHCNKPSHFFVVAAFNGLCLAPPVSLATVNMGHGVKEDLFSTVFGIAEMIYGIMVLTGPPFVGVLVELFGEYKKPFYLAAGLYLIASLLFLLADHRRQDQKPEQERIE